MNTRFKRTRRNRSSKPQSGGALLQYKSLRIFGINEKLGDNIYGIKTLIEAMEAGKIDKKYAIRMRRDIFLQKGNLFNGSVAYYTYKDTPFLLGCCRTLSPRDGDDEKTNTSIHNRDPFSSYSAWVGGWLGPDYPLFFALNLTNDEIVFLHMQFQINYMTKQMFYTHQMEDPRIMIHPDADLVLFYGHHDTQLNENNFYNKIGANLHKNLNAGEKKPNNGKHPQLPYTSYCRKKDINDILEAHFFTKDRTKRIVPNQPWKPLCANLLNIDTEKNWTIIPNMIDGKIPSVDFVRSIGDFSRGMVVYRAPVDWLTAPPVLPSGEVNEYAFKCVYIQSIEGKVKLPSADILPRAFDGYFDVPNNDKISIISYKTKRWLSTLLRLFVDYLPNNQTTYFKSSKCSITKNDAGITFKNPFFVSEKDHGHVDPISRATLEANNVLIVKGISTGGPACPILAGKPGEIIGVGHLKLWHWNVYLVMIAALLYKADPAFRATMGKSKLPADEQPHFLDFINYLTTEINMFRYTYTIYQQFNPYVAHANISGLAKGDYEKQNIIHKNQMYSSFFYKMSKENFQLLTLSPQFYMDNFPTECHAPILQFCSTIANNGKDTYYIPYGDNDTRARIAMISRDDLHSYLKLEKVINEVKPDTDHAYYLSIMKEFYKIHIIKPAPSE